MDNNMKIVVAMRKEDNSIIGVDIKGDIHILPETGTVDQWVASGGYNTLTMSYRRHCSVYHTAIVDKVVFNLIQMRLKGQDIDNLHIYEIMAYGVKLQIGKEYPFNVDLKPDKRWHCEWTGCKYRNHYTCVHAQYASRMVPIEAVTPRQDTDTDYSDLIDSY